MRKKMGIVTLLGVLASMLTIQPGAMATDDVRPDGNWTGADVSGPGPEFAHVPQVQEKIALTKKFESVRAGRGSAADYELAAQSYFARYGHPHPGQAPARMTTVTATSSPAEVVLSVKHYPQRRNYYCGPATGMMIVKMADGSINSRYDGSTFLDSQYDFAKDNHMMTDRYGKTGWDSGLFVRGLNRWRGNSYYVQVDSPSGSFMESVLVYSIGYHRMPVAGDTVEFYNGWHYNHHPNRKAAIGHWITSYSYASSGAWSRWADPSTSVWEDLGTRATFAYDTSTFANRFLQNNGVAY